MFLSPSGIWVSCIFSFATGGPSAQVVGLPMGPGFRMDPYFAEEDHRQASTEGLLSKNMTVIAGQTAYLECKVRNLGAKRVRLLYYITELTLLKLNILSYLNVTAIT